MTTYLKSKYLISIIILIVSVFCSLQVNCYAQEFASFQDRTIDTLSPPIQNHQKLFIYTSNLLTNRAGIDPLESAFMKDIMFESTNINKEYFGKYIDKMVLFVNAAKDIYSANKKINIDFANKKTEAELVKKEWSFGKKISRMFAWVFISKDKFNINDPVRNVAFQKEQAYQDMCDEIMNAYGFDKRMFYIINSLQKEYFSNSTHIKIDGLRKLATIISAYYPEYGHINNENYMLYEVALRSKINFTEEKKDVKKIENYLIRILYPKSYLDVSSTYSYIFEQFNKMDKNDIDTGISLIKWLANTAELNDIPGNSLKQEVF
ncbi:MAG: hypothetical protein KJ915_01450 [Candidatus Omnitrophica bacterium]|nr:hypothetical protein [Candidatus Omnitrophota bacterium]